MMQMNVKRDGCHIYANNFDIYKLRYICRFIELKEPLKMLISDSADDVVLDCDTWRYSPEDKHRQI
jgi:phage regulator Rha-like protein